MRVEARARGGISIARIRRAARNTFQLEHAEGQITIVLVNDARIRKLNREYHGVDRATDILTFPFDTTYLGDLIISIDQAKLNARHAKWTPADEFDLLVVHGILHLLGYDDMTKPARKRMWKRQEEILGHPIPGEV